MKRFDCSGIRIGIPLILLYLVWGSTYFVVLIALETIPPLLICAVRFFIASLVIGITALFTNTKYRKGQLEIDIALGFMFFTCSNGSVAWGEQFVSSGIIAAIQSLTPFWMIVLDKKRWAMYLNNRRLLFGLALGLLGALFLVASIDSLLGPQPAYLVILVIIAGTIMWSAASIAVSKRDFTFANMSIQFLSGGIFSILISSLAGETKNFALGKVSMLSWAAVFYLAIFGSLIGFACYKWLLRSTKPAVVGTYAYVTPVVAAILGYSFAGESLNIIQIVGTSIILLGLMLVKTSDSR